MRNLYTNGFGRTLLLFILFAALSNQSLFAQVDITIGNGTTANTNTTYPNPLQDRYEGSRAQYLIRASELNAAGMGAGAITAIKFNVTSIGTGTTAVGIIENYTIKIGHSSKASLDLATWEGGVTTVVNPVNYQPVVGVNTFTFSTPFNWNGTDNLLIEICNGADVTTGTTFTYNTLVNWTTGLGFNANHTYRADNLNNLCGSATVTQTGTETTRPNMVLTWAAAGPCTSPPVAGTATINLPFTCAGTPISLGMSGGSYGSGQTYQWESSTAVGGPFTPVGAPQAAAAYNLNSPLGVTYWRAAVTCSGNTSYSNVITVTGRGPLSAGNYTINSGSATSLTNFQTFAAAIDALKCGIAGAVVFDVTPGSGPYNEQVILNAIPGSSATNTITFNGNGATLAFPSASTDERAVIKLNDADYITFDSLRIDATNGTYGFGVQLINNADFNNFRRCTIISENGSTSTNFAGVVISASATSATGTGATNCDNNTFDGNTVIGGYYGMTMVGGTGALILNNKFTGNKVQEFYLYGIYVSYTDNALISHNQISRPTRTTSLSTFYGIYFSTGSQRANVTRNRISNGFGTTNTSTSDFYGIYFTGCDAPSAANANLVTNNLIFNITGSGDVGGLYNSSSDHVRYYHNTISLDGTSPAATATNTLRGIYQTTAAVGIEYKDNLVSISNSSLATKTAIYLNTTTSTITSDYNNFAISSTTGTNNIGSWGTAAQATLADWRTASSKDANSLSILPSFVDVNTGNYAPNEPTLDNKGTPIAGVTTDILAQTRSASTPDIGAYEWSPVVCTDPPVPGTLNTSQTPVCLGTPFTLGFTGGTIGSGQTYQWQISTDNGATWNNVPGATSTTLTTTQPVTSRYRLMVHCGNNTVPSAPIEIVTPALASGVYTINSGGGADFTSFNAAYNFLKCGINGPVTFNVTSTATTYTEQLIMEQIPGTSPVNTVTFNGNGNTIAFTATDDNERAVIKLNGADFIRFDSLGIKALGTGSAQYGFGVHLINNADSNTFSRCIISVDSVSTGTTYAGIVISGSHTSATTTASLCDGNIFDRNKVNGGYYSMTVMGSSTLYSSYNRITRNTFSNFYFYGIYLNGTFDVRVDSNTIKRPERTVVSTFNGIYFTGISAKANVTRNTITNPFGGNPASTSVFNGIYFTASDPLPAVKNNVTNNLIYNLNGNGDVTGFYNSSSDNISYLHNTLSLDGAASTSTATTVTRGFYQTTLAAGLEIKNNIISITRGGPGVKHGLFFNTNTSEIVSNNNDLFIGTTAGTTFIGNAGATDFPILANWQLGTQMDGNSTSNDPFFTNPAAGDFTPFNVSVNDLGEPLNILIDIYGRPRSVTAPDPGAIEFNPPACVVPPTPGVSTVSETPVCENSLVMLGLTGHSTGFGQTYVWEVSSDIAGPYAPITSATANPAFTITANSTQYYRCAITCGGNTVYSTPVLLSVTPGLPGGNYTIDASQPASSTNFISFNAAKDAMACGITGPVVIDVVSGTGPYIEQVIFDSIRGTSASNTVTFNGNGNTIKFNSTNTNERAVIKLNSTDYFIFDSLIVDASEGTYGFGFHLINNADSNIIRRCTVLSSPTSTSSNFAGIVLSGTATSATGTTNSLSDYNTISGNTITGGYYGITSIGATAQPLLSNKIINNKVREFYFYGIYIGSNNNTLVERNDIERPTRTAVSTFYGVYFSGTSNRCVINANRIHNTMGGAPTSTSQENGIYITGVDGLLGQENLVTNNAIYNFNGSGVQYGFYNASSNYVKYYHNTISLDNIASTSTSTTRGFYQTTESEGIDIRNNIITVSRGGTGIKHAIYMATAATQYVSNNNDFVVSGANSYIGYSGGNRATLADWQTASTMDANSISLDPAYTNVGTGNLTPTQGSIDNLGVPVGVATDILQSTRSVTTPDLGAFEFAVTPCTTPPVAGSSVSVPSSGVCLGESIVLNLTGNSQGGFQTYRWQRGASATGPWEDISGELHISEFHHMLSSPNSWFRAAVTCSGNTQFSTPVQVVLNPLLLAGDYTINPANPSSSTNFQSFAAAVSILNCGIAGPVRFHVSAGTYTEQIRMRAVPGSSTTSTVTFMSETGDPASVTLTNSSTVAANNYTLKLDSASNIIYKNMTIAATHATNGRAIELAGTAGNDSILNCTILVPVSTSTSNVIAGIFAGTITGAGNVIKDNRITNGSSGIYIAGTANATNQYIIENNTVNGSYYYGIYAANLNRSSFNRNKLTRTGVMNSTSYAMYLSNCDTAYKVDNNRVDITNSGTIVYGIYLTGCQSSQGLKGSVSNNRIIAGAGNTGNQYGLYTTTTNNNRSLNNVIMVNTTGATSYGIYSTGMGGISYQNNSVESYSPANAITNVAAYFSQTSGAEGAVNIRNNIFSHVGGGRAMYIANPNFIYSDYNMYHTTGSVLIQWGTALSYATLQPWRDTSYWDYNSIAYKPAFATGTELQPDLASPAVWAVHGRGVQIENNNVDINGAARPVTLTEGVPDLGAYEFLPTSTPIALTATPAAPAPNTTQVFMLGTDTVTKITWGANVPGSVTGRRYTGVKPPALATGQQHMYFYTDFDFTGTAPTGHKVKQFYMDPWLGFIPAEPVIKLGRTNAGNTWDVSANSTVAVYENTIDESNLAILDKYTGLTDGTIAPLPPITVSPSDSSNMGQQFWVGYGHHQDFGSGNAQNMVLYLGAGATPASVTVRINGTNWSKNYVVPANTVISSDFMPKYGLFDARLLNEGLSDKGISITSNVPITAYAHIYGNTNSGATMLMPVGTYGHEYYALTSRQNYGTNTYSWVNVIAAYDSTVVEITPSQPTVGGRPAGVPFTVQLKKGEVYQVMGAIISGSDGYDMTGTKLKSISNQNGKCYPIAVFSGSSRTNLGCGGNMPTGSGDNIIQQNFPYRAWGRKYLTAPTSASTAANVMHNNIYKVAVKDPTTVVTLNGTQLTGLIDNLYYQFESNAATYIESDKPVMVAQFIPSQGGNAACGNVGVLDPEMIYLSPLEQGIKSVSLYRNTEYNILAQYLTLIIPSNGVNSLTIDGSNTFDYVYDHPNRAGYKVVVKRWDPAANAQAFAKSDSAFTAITYGLGSAESYGYNAGTLVKNLNVFPSISNVYNTLATANAYTCDTTPVRISVLSTVQPQVIEWKLSTIPQLSPNADVTQNNPTPTATVVMSGVTYYQYTLPVEYRFTAPGVYNIPVFITHPDVEGCNNRMESSIPITVLPEPKPDFPNNMIICPGGTVQFDGSAVTNNNTAVASWSWEFGDNGTAAVEDPTHTFANPGVYNVKLSMISAEGCVGDTVKPVTVAFGPVITLAPDSIGACLNDNVTFTIQNPVANAVYTWYSAPTGGTVVTTGTSYTVNNVTAPATFYIESSLNGCLSQTRKKVQLTVRASLAIPIVVVDSAGSNLVRFRWNSVAGATSYEVTTNAGTTWITPSSGALGLTHTVTGMSVGQSVTLQVRALGGCLPTVSQAVTGQAVSDEVFIPNTFTPNNDGMNDQLRVYSNVIKSMKFMIFNQWGEKIYEANGVSASWDGTFKGKSQPSGVYMYVADIILVDGTRITRKGSVNLVR